jgi:hypothetical protein
VAIVYLILFIVAALLFLFAAIPGAHQGKLNLVALGLLAWVLVEVLKTAVGMNGG